MTSTVSVITLYNEAENEEWIYKIHKPENKMFGPHEPQTAQKP